MVSLVTFFLDMDVIGYSIFILDTDMISDREKLWKSDLDASKQKLDMNTDIHISILSGYKYR